MQVNKKFTYKFVCRRKNSLDKRVDGCYNIYCYPRPHKKVRA